MMGKGHKRVLPGIRSSPCDFRAIYAEELSYVCNSLKRLGVHDADLEDLAHEVFLRLIRSYSSYDPKRPFRPWLFGLIFRIASDHRRLARHHREVRDGHLELTAVAVAGDDPVETGQRRDLVLQALEKVDLRRRAVFILKEIDDCTVAEIAEALSLPSNTVYSRLRVAWTEFEAALRSLQADEDCH
jgi:RNA polymerase sigma-70 factor (ECF subfamily)